MRAPSLPDDDFSIDIQELDPAAWAGIVILQISPVVAPERTFRSVRLPREVILSCAAERMVPEIDPITVREAKVSTDVIAGCAAVLSVPEIEPLTDKSISSGKS
ncbi:unnamed protein product [Phytophthora fragariaefolia]|uniref:Unnamed protein product n=1 Tax=Phytophthora fragariaefolia TaxID=1490495 RepID=A0A9W6X4S8_9STRA|nr:unnamed protein product [Phytophthora fragariaefolia]